MIKKAALIFSFKVAFRFSGVIERYLLLVNGHLPEGLHSF
jgi:hypothetical protein